MENIKKYIQEVLGVDIVSKPLSKEQTDKLPFYIKEAFRLSATELFNQPIIFAESPAEQLLTTLQLEKQIQQIKNVYGKKVVLVTTHLSALDRKRLIQKGINFIVPGTQLFLPDLFVDMRETFIKRKQKKEQLIPSAQFILLYKLLHPTQNMEEWSLKQLAATLQYTQMGISKAIDNLKAFELCTTEGTKEKYIRFNRNTPELWEAALPYLVNPVLRKFYVDELPHDTYLLKSNTSALPEYSAMTASRQEYRAIEKNMFYSLQKNTALLNMNGYEGRYCIEIWKYDPAKLSADLSYDQNVDPLSLYLSLKDSHDARTEMALEQMIATFIYNK